MALVSSIEKGIVIDHIKAGQGTRILRDLNIDTSRYTIAFIMNATSKRRERKDLIKIADVTDIDLTALGFIDPHATVNIIENHTVVRKIKLELPERVVNIIRCKNPRCVTSVEPNVKHIFHLIDANKREYRCEYCDDIVTTREELQNETMHP